MLIFLDFILSHLLLIYVIIFMPTVITWRGRPLSPQRSFIKCSGVFSDFMLLYYLVKQVCSVPRYTIGIPLSPAIYFVSTQRCVHIQNHVFPMLFNFFNEGVYFLRQVLYLCFFLDLVLRVLLNPNTNRTFPFSCLTTFGPYERVY